MNILIMTIGSRGDIQPFLCLAIGLRKYGHNVRIAGFEVFRQFITRCERCRMLLMLCCYGDNTRQLRVRFLPAGRRPQEAHGPVPEQPALLSQVCVNGQLILM